MVSPGSTQDRQTDGVIGRIGHGDWDADGSTAVGIALADAEHEQNPPLSQDSTEAETVTDGLGARRPGGDSSKSATVSNPGDDHCSDGVASRFIRIKRFPSWTNGFCLV